MRISIFSGSRRIFSCNILQPACCWLPRRTGTATKSKWMQFGGVHNSWFTHVEAQWHHEWILPTPPHDWRLWRRHWCIGNFSLWRSSRFGAVDEQISNSNQLVIGYQLMKSWSHKKFVVNSSQRVNSPDKLLEFQNSSHFLESKKYVKDSTNCHNKKLTLPGLYMFPVIDIFTQQYTAQVFATFGLVPTGILGAVSGCVRICI